MDADAYSYADANAHSHVHACKDSYADANGRRTDSDAHPNANCDGDTACRRGRDKDVRGTASFDGTNAAVSGGRSITQIGSTCSYWIQVAARASGVAGSQWYTDLGLFNPGSTPANVEVRLYPPGSATPKSNSSYVPATAQSLLTDIAGQLCHSGSGALEVRSDRPLKVTSRTYNMATNGGTFGQFYAPHTPTQGLVNGESAFVPHLIENSRFRSNLAFTNMGSSPATVAVELFNGAGTKLTTFTVTLSPFEYKQEYQVLKNRGGQANLDRGWARVTVSSGSGLIVSASVIDNTTNDPTTIPMQRLALTRLSCTSDRRRGRGRSGVRSTHALHQPWHWRYGRTGPASPHFSPGFCYATGSCRAGRRTQASEPATYRQVRLGSSALRSPTIIGISGRSRRTSVRKAGYPRSTEGLDLAIAARPPSLAKLTNELRREGWSVEVRPPDAQDPLGGVVDIRAPGAYLVQVVNFDNSPAGGFPRLVEEAAHTARPLVPNGRLKVVDLPLLVAFKLYAGGNQSRSDICELLDLHPDRIDEVRERCNVLGLGRRLERILDDREDRDPER